MFKKIKRGKDYKIEDSKTFSCYPTYYFAQLAGAVEYIDCTSAEG